MYYGIGGKPLLRDLGDYEFDTSRLLEDLEEISTIWPIQPPDDHLHIYVTASSDPGE